MAIKISTPRTTTIKTPNGTGTLEWSPDFGARKSGEFNKGQDYIDDEVIAKCAPRIPLKTGALIRSGTRSGGEVSYTASYAGRQYRTSPSRGYDPNRGGQWFERMKAAERAAILRGASAVVGAKDG
ncbi:MAG: minor capsid protein [Peptococcaceae bacterium]|nr:minor capsid protein [Peptococcaceae bacterium]